MNIKQEKENLECYLDEHCHPKISHNTKVVISRFNDDLCIKLYQFYLNRRTEVPRHEIVQVTNRFWQQLNEINHPDIEYYLEYCLEFYQQDFLLFLSAVYGINREANLILKDICANYLRYSGKKEREMLGTKIDTIYIPFHNKNVDLVESLHNVRELEKNHILRCYELARNGITFCETCAPTCLVKKDKNNSSQETQYKRTIPFRV